MVNLVNNDFVVIFFGVIIFLLVGKEYKLILVWEFGLMIVIEVFMFVGIFLINVWEVYFCFILVFNVGVFIVFVDLFIVFSFFFL